MLNISEDMVNDLYEVLLALESKEDCKKLLNDLCTKKELANMAQRIRAAKLLIKGETYNQVMSKTSIATATLARVSECVKYGEGYKKFLK